MVKDFDYFVDRDHQITNKIYKTQQKADILWMEQLTSAQGERQVNSFQIKNQKPKKCYTLRCQINESTRLAFLDFFLTLLALFPPHLFIWAYSTPLD